MFLSKVDEEASTKVDCVITYSCQKYTQTWFLPSPNTAKTRRMATTSFIMSNEEGWMTILTQPAEKKVPLYVPMDTIVQHILMRGRSLIRQSANMGNKRWLICINCASWQVCPKMTLSTPRGWNIVCVFKRIRNKEIVLGPLSVAL